MYEILPIEVYEKKYNSFRKCENFWVSISDEEAYSMIELAYQISCEENDERTYLQHNNAIEFLASGKVMLLPLYWIREANDYEKCPLCGNSITVFPALSRRDNKTYICPDCGTKEALEDMTKTRML